MATCGSWDKTRGLVWSPLACVTKSPLQTHLFLLCPQEPFSAYAVCFLFGLPGVLPQLTHHFLSGPSLHPFVALTTKPGSMKSETLFCPPSSHCICGANTGVAGSKCLMTSCQMVKKPVVCQSLSRVLRIQRK